MQHLVGRYHQTAVSWSSSYIDYHNIAQLGSSRSDPTWCFLVDSVLDPGAVVGGLVGGAEVGKHEPPLLLKHVDHEAPAVELLWPSAMVFELQTDVLCHPRGDHLKSPG